MKEVRKSQSQAIADCILQAQRSIGKSPGNLGEENHFYAVLQTIKKYR